MHLAILKEFNTKEEGDLIHLLMSKENASQDRRTHSIVGTKYERMYVLEEIEISKTGMFDIEVSINTFIIVVK